MSDRTDDAGYSTSGEVREDLVQVPGGSLYVTTHRPVDRVEPVRGVVALHGGPGVDGGSLRYALSDLGAQYEVVVPDQRGHGRSMRSTPAHWTLDTWADDVAVIVQTFGLSRPTLFGISFGGWVAIRCAARHPTLFRGLVVVSMTARLPTVEEVAIRMGALGGPAAAAAWLRGNRSLDDPGAVKEMQQRSEPLMARQPLDPGLDQARREQIRTPEVNAHFTPLFESMDLTGDLAHVTCPVDVIVGESDPLTSPARAEATSERHRPSRRQTHRRARRRPRSAQRRPQERVDRNRCCDRRNMSGWRRSVTESKTGSLTD